MNQYYDLIPNSKTDLSVPSRSTIDSAARENSAIAAAFEY